MADDMRLVDALADALGDDDREPPADRVAALRADVTRRFRDEAIQPSPPRAARPSRGLQVAAVAAAAASLVALVVLMLQPDASIVEFDGDLAAVTGSATAEVSVRALATGRAIELSSDDLPMLPTGDYYELWFVGAGDAPGDPNRISAGTWHPDEQGASNVQFQAAVDPEEYPVIVVTAEPGDGDPAATGPEVLRSDPINES